MDPRLWRKFGGVSHKNPYLLTWRIWRLTKRAYILLLLLAQDFHCCYLFLGDVRDRRCTYGTTNDTHSGQRARASSVGKTPSFSFCHVDMYALGDSITRLLENNECHSNIFMFLDPYIIPSPAIVGFWHIASVVLFPAVKPNCLLQCPVFSHSKCYIKTDHTERERVLDIILSSYKLLVNAIIQSIVSLHLKCRHQRKKARKGAVRRGEGAQPQIYDTFHDVDLILHTTIVHGHFSTEHLWHR